MCIEEISGLEIGSDWEGFIDKSNSSIAELNSCKREITVLYQNNALDACIYKRETHEYSLQNRSVTHRALEAMKISPMDAGGSVQVDLEYKWGGQDGNKWSGGASGEVHDDHGNYAKGEIKQESSGEGSVKVSGGHREDENKAK